MPAGINQDLDDVDALVLWENGIAGYQPTTGPFSWLAGTDMLLYSVRRGSFAIGMPDALFGAPIEEGDILIPVATPAGGFAPGIFIPAEDLGLATVRGGTAAMYGIINPAYGADVWADDLDALDVVPEPTCGTTAADGGRPGRDDPSPIVNWILSGERPRAQGDVTPGLKAVFVMSSASFKR